MDPSPRPIKRVTEREVYRNRFVVVFDDDVLLRDETRGHYVRIVSGDGSPGVAILAMSDGHIALVRTFRYPLDRWEWGIPRGFGHSPDPAVSARAELIEELGTEPDGLVPFGQIAPDSGLLANTVELFIARYSQCVATPTDTREIADVAWVGREELFAQIASGTLTDSYTLAAVGVAVAHRLIPPPD